MRDGTALAFSALLLAACGGGREPEAPAPPGTGGTLQESVGPASLPRLAECGGFKTTQAAAILGIPEAEVESSTSQVHATLWTCAYKRRGEPATAVSFSLSHEPSAQEAAAAFAEERENLELAQGVIAGAGGPQEKEPAVQPISGLGDEAFWTPVNESLVVRVANVRVQVMFPNGRDAQQRVAEAVVAALR